MKIAKPEVPFPYQGKQDFPEKLTAWIGDVFYDILPDQGYEIRDEQIYTAYQIAEAVCKGKVHLAEAGLGTGKTFAYLLTAVAYARFKGKPAIIACASTALQEQLAGPRGDIEKLAQLLGMPIDVRMAKDPHQYVCDTKINRLHVSLAGYSDPTLEDVLAWASDTDLGERSELPQVSDPVWKRVAWDEDMACDTCSSRGFCKLVKAREHYREAVDLIVCDHNTFFRDLWTREEKIANGERPLLPEYATVIFDEGHKVLLPAALSAGRQVDRQELGQIVAALERIQGARTSLVSVAFALDQANALFFETLEQSAHRDERTERMAVKISDQLLQAAVTLRRALDSLLFEFQNEQALHSHTFAEAGLHAHEVSVERAIEALNRFGRNRAEDVICWLDKHQPNFWVVPRDLSGMFRQHLLNQGLPVIFSSATLSTGGDFGYFAGTLGLQSYSSSTVGSAFDYKERVTVYLPQQPLDKQHAPGYQQALQELASLLVLSQGRALVLTNAPSEVAKIRRGLEGYQLPFEFLWEDRGERGYLIREFREKTSSVLVGWGFWEGLDVPGEALSLLVVWQLPFPPLDPLVEARKQEVQAQGQDPVATVDYPEMALRLKQGCGRLIRTREDRGAIAILEPVLGTPWEKPALGALPEGAPILRRLENLDQTIFCRVE